METAEARRRVAAARVGHLATVTPEGRPHLVPCCFALVDDALVSAVDGKPKSTTALRRLANVEAHPAVTLLVDHYDDGDWSALWWVRVDGRARVVRDGPERERGLDALGAKHRQYREVRPPGALIVVEDLTWRSWP
ncbi:TIGR03668 family PPOX class F420-dependent oxidoreductase [Iamia majanohamensis]|uniref:TIGR03668 family PPOX class F420-dependent oxidoreductase n=1 Tax=Iamia majanohamensis TaxID=467976 RepID=A0AAF0BVM7_9ACTN|nr:TIGR03668 family PPOX class F420-dependent oxidoreductase [Iamia majanohamensis]WCO66534.1 TIGR03668 family PPOX class F420-dependent oxidoreductase [Iamia majanohamensis]